MKKKKMEEENLSAQPEKVQELTKEEMEATAEVTGDNLNSTDEERAPFKEKAKNKAMLRIFSKNSSEFKKILAKNDNEITQERLREFSVLSFSLEKISLTISQKSEKDKDKKAGEFYKASGEEFAKIHNLLKKAEVKKKLFGLRGEEVLFEALNEDGKMEKRKQDREAFLKVLRTLDKNINLNKDIDKDAIEKKVKPATKPLEKLKKRSRK